MATLDEFFQSETKEKKPKEDNKKKKKKVRKETTHCPACWAVLEVTYHPDQAIEAHAINCKLVATRPDMEQLRLRLQNRRSTPVKANSPVRAPKRPYKSNG